MCASVDESVRVREVGGAGSVIVRLNTAINTRLYCDLSILLELIFSDGLNSNSGAAKVLKTVFVYGSGLDPDSIGS